MTQHAKLRESVALPASYHDDTMISPKQTARWLNISELKLAKTRVEGDGPAFAKFGRSVKYRVGDVRDFIRKRTFQSTASYSEGRPRRSVGAATVESALTPQELDRLQRRQMGLALEEEGIR